jgi:hypothetical protein
MWDAYRKHHGQDGDPVLVWQADTRSMNPTVGEDVIREAYEADEAAASAEYGAEFRRDIESYIAREAVDAVTVPGRHELPPVSGTTFTAAVDPSGGSGTDSMTLAIAHTEEREGAAVAVLDCLRERRPPFSPESVVAEFCETLRLYGVVELTGDRFGGEFCREPFRKAGIEYALAEKPKSDVYKECLPLVNSKRVELLDHARLRAQLLALERRTARGGRDSIDQAGGERSGRRRQRRSARAVDCFSGCKHRIRLRHFDPDDGKPTDRGNLQILQLNHARQLARRW